MANSLTIFRLCIGLPLILLLINEFYAFAWFLLIAGGLSDFLDGWLARKANDGQNIWGSRLDPLADKFLLAAPIIWLVYNQTLPIWSVWLLFIRELYISSWRSFHKEGGPASISGKIKTLLQFLSILLMIWPLSWGNSDLVNLIHSLGWFLFWPSLFIGLYSAVNYLFDG